MNWLLRDRDVRRLACILVGCAVAWQLWRWTPMLRPWVTTWLTEGDPAPGKSSGAAADPWAAFTPQTLLPLVLYVAGAVVVESLDLEPEQAARPRPAARTTAARAEERKVLRATMGLLCLMGRRFLPLAQ